RTEAFDFGGGAIEAILLVFGEQRGAGFDGDAEGLRAGDMPSGEQIMPEVVGLGEKFIDRFNISFFSDVFAEATFAIEAIELVHPVGAGVALAEAGRGVDE